MKIVSLRTPVVSAGAPTLTELLDGSLHELTEGSIVAITSKIVSLCESNTRPIEGTDKEILTKQESQQYLPPANSKYGHHFTITNNTLISMAGIDESNADGVYVLWPQDSQQTANETWAYLRRRFGLKNVGVIITDSTCQPLRRGTTGICLAHCGFKAVNDYRGNEDLFGRPLKVTVSNVSGGLAAAAVVMMGEGAEQTPLAVISDISFAAFQDRIPTADELAMVSIPLDEDLFAPFLGLAPWEPGGQSSYPGR